MKNSKEIYSDMKNVFEFHYNNCELYRKYCIKNECKPSDINSIEDLCKIPQIPTAVFKQFDVLSKKIEECTCCLSSGTKGFTSKIYRDEETINKFLDLIDDSIKKLYGCTKDNCIVLNLGPDVEEAYDIWMGLATSLVRTRYNEYFFTHSMKIDVEKFINFFNDEEKIRDKKIIIFGAPTLFLRVFDYIEQNQIDFSIKQEAIVITAGGWKNAKGETLSKEEFYKKFETNLGISSDYIYDAYNQVEMNTPIFECRNHKKHIPENLKVIIRDPVTLEPLPYGKEGVITFLDSSAKSFPCFVITDDIGYLTEKCECGLDGPIFNYKRRVLTVETKGCALKMDQFVKK